MLDPLSAIAYAAFFVTVTLVTARRPVIGVCALIAVQPFAFYEGISTTTITLPKVALVGVFLGVFTFRDAFAPIAARAPWRILTAAMFLLLATVLSYAQARYHAPVLRESLKAFEYIVLFCVVVAGYRLDPDRRAVGTIILATTTAVCVLALAQEIVGSPSVLLINGHKAPRIAGPLEGPNQLAGYFDVALPLVMALAIDRPSRLAQLTLFLIVCTDVLTYSRGGAVGAVGGITIIIWIYRGRVRALIRSMAAGLTAGAGVAASWGIVAHSLGIFRLWDMDESYAGGVGTRPELWHAAISLWMQHKLLGIGAGNFELEIPLTGLNGVRTHANSLYLQSLVEGGLPLLIATLYVTYTSIATFVRERTESPFVAGALAGSIALAVHQTIDFLTFYPKVGGEWWIVLALGAAELAIPVLAGRAACA